MKNSNSVSGCLEQTILLAMLLLVGLTLISQGGPQQASAQGTIPVPTIEPKWQVDADSATADIDGCRTIQNADAFEAGVVVSDAPNLHRFGFVLHFDGRYVGLSGVNVMSEGFRIEQVRYIDLNSVEIAARLHLLRPSVPDGVARIRLRFTVKGPNSQTDLDLISASLVTLDGDVVLASSDAIQRAKAQVNIDPTGSVGC